MAFDLIRGAPPPTRRRNALLEALELFRDADPNTRLSTVLAFLYLCENEGFCVSELAAAAGMTLATASRAARSLTAPDAPGALPPALGLAELRPIGKVRALHLTAAGRALRDRLDRTFVHATTIAQQEYAK
ncbi:MAG: MarR family transcriptional regulator [Brevundimonas sp.]|nr:MarR family transcriptional regulator [Brevundimonas sp.]